MRNLINEGGKGASGQADRRTGGQVDGEYNDYNIRAYGNW